MKHLIIKTKEEQNLKKLLTFITMLFMTICMGIPVYAEETSPRRLDVQLVQVSLRDSGNQVH